MTDSQPSDACGLAKGSAESPSWPLTCEPRATGMNRLSIDLRKRGRGYPVIEGYLYAESSQGLFEGPDDPATILNIGFQHLPKLVGQVSLGQEDIAVRQGSSSVR